MRNPVLSLVAVTLLSSLFVSCKKDDGPATQPKLIFKFKFDSTQVRLNNFGNPSTIPAGNAGQSPVFNKMSAHYIELAPTMLTALGSGAVLYHAPETTAGGSNAIDFEKSNPVGNDEVFYSVPLSSVTPGQYDFLRVSLAYQNFNVKYLVDTVINNITIKQEFPGTAAGFIGYNSYIKTLKVKDQSLNVNSNKLQGFWAFETTVYFGGVSFPFISSGQAPPGATTVPNPINATSPIPPGSCVVTSGFSNVPNNKLTITGKETKDIVIEVSLSTNKSFEWKEVIADGKWSPTKGEAVVDMGIRGMVARINQ